MESQNAPKPTPLSITIEEPRKIHKTPFGSASIYQIYFDEFSRSQIDPGFTAVHNAHPTTLLESDVIEQLVREGAHHEADFFGVFSWKSKLKLGISSELVMSSLSALRFDLDVLTFPFDELGPNVWTRNTPEGIRSAPFLRAGNMIMGKLGIDVDLKSLKTPIIYQNAFLARTWVWDKYFKEMLGPALDILRNPEETELHESLSYKSQYPVFGSLRQRILKAFGNSFYTFHPFLAEILFPTWVALQPEELRPRIFTPRLPRIRAGTGTCMGAC